MSNCIPGIRLDSHFETEFPLSLRSKFRNLSSRGSNKRSIFHTQLDHVLDVARLFGVSITNLPVNELTNSNMIRNKRQKPNNWAVHLGVQCSCSSRSPFFCILRARHVHKHQFHDSLTNTNHILESPFSSCYPFHWRTRRALLLIAPDASLCSKF
jgi:hypothetical protein